jgi:hypothetical protein
LGLQLGLVCRDPDVRFHANKLGIPLFRSTSSAQAQPWRRRGQGRQRKGLAPTKARQAPADLPEAVDLRQERPKRDPGWQSNDIIRTLFFILGLAAVAAIAGIFLPSASIRLTPRVERQEITFTTLTGPTITTVNPSGAIPSRSITVVVEGRDTVETSGSITLPATPATGQVVFTNLSSQPVQIPAGTVLISSGSEIVRFKTDEAGSTPAEAGQSIEIPISAIDFGPAGNLSAGSIRTIEGPLGLQLAVVNVDPTTGGTALPAGAPTPLDRSRGYRALLDSLRETARQEIEALLEPGDFLISTTPFLKATLEESYLPTENVPAEVLALTLRMEFEMLAITRADLEALADTVLDADLPAGFEPLAGTRQINLLTDPAIDQDGTGSWDMQVSREVQAVITRNQAIALGLGLSPSQAALNISGNLALNADPEIALSPGWWPRLPLLPFRIEVLLAE